MGANQARCQQVYGSQPLAYPAFSGYSGYPSYPSNSAFQPQYSSGGCGQVIFTLLDIYS